MADLAIEEGNQLIDTISNDIAERLAEIVSRIPFTFPDNTVLSFLDLVRFCLLDESEDIFLLHSLLEWKT